MATVAPCVPIGAGAHGGAVDGLGGQKLSWPLLADRAGP